MRDEGIALRYGVAELGCFAPVGVFASRGWLEVSPGGFSFQIFAISKLLLPQSVRWGFSLRGQRDASLSKDRSALMRAVSAAFASTTSFAQAASSAARACLFISSSRARAKLP
jgi:hypothetical protein